MGFSKFERQDIIKVWKLLIDFTKAVYNGMDA